METAVSAARVVIVEDHVLVRELLVSLVQDELECEVAAHCTTSQEGINACLRERPDLAIVDWMLPDGRGFDVVRTTGSRLTRTRWLFLSSNEQEHLVKEAVQLGVHGFVLKKAPLDVLCEAIRRVLSGGSYYCAQSASLLVEAMRSEALAGPNLSLREREVLRWLASGENPKEIAFRLGVTVKTVQNHLFSLKEKLFIHEPAGLVRYAIKHGYVEPP